MDGIPADPGAPLASPPASPPPRGLLAGWRGLTIAALGAIAVLASVAPTIDPDLWWHLQTGRLALRGASLDADPFSFSHAGAPWAYRDLVADVLLYAGFAALGYAWFALLKAGVVVALAASLAGAQRPDERAPDVVLLALAALLGWLPLVERPNLFSVAAFAILVALLERARARAAATGGRALAAAFAPLVVLQWAWACLHRAAVLGVLLLAGFALYLAVARLAAGALAPLVGRRPSRRGVVVAAATAGLGLAASVLTPGGLATLTTSLAVAQSAMLRDHVLEWRRLPPAALVAEFPYPLALAGAALAALAWRLGRARRRREEAPPVEAWHLGLLLLFGALALDSVRWIPYLATVAALLLARLAAEARGALAARWAGPRPRGAILLVAVLAVAHVGARRAAPFTLGPARHLFPAGAVAFARAHGLAGPVANTFELGGYLIWGLWPQARVLVDGRNDLVYPPAFVERALRAQDDPAEFAAMRAADGATWVVAANHPGHLSFPFLARDPAWGMVYWSEEAVIYARRQDHPALAARAFRYVDPLAVDASVARATAAARGAQARLDAVEAEVIRLVDASPDGVRANVAWAIFLHFAGPARCRERDAVVRTLDAIAPGDPAVRELRTRFPACD